MSVEIIRAKIVSEEIGVLSKGRIDDTRLDRVVVEFKYNGKRYERKVSFRHNGNLGIVRFNNKKYFLYEYENDPYSRNPGYRQLVEMDEESLKLLDYLRIENKNWTVYKYFLLDLEKEAEEFEVEEISVPSAPDTSKFFATKNGQVKFCENAAVYYECFTSTVTYGLKIGSIFPDPSIFRRAYIISKYFEHFLKYSGGYPRVQLIVKNGTAYDTIGLGN